MKTYIDKIHESEIYALDQTINVWKKILDKKDALMTRETYLVNLKVAYANSTSMKGNCILCEHYGNCETCVLKSCYSGEAIYANILKAIESSDSVMFVCYVERLISKCYVRIRELTEIRRIELCFKYRGEALADEENALSVAIDIYLYLQYHPETMFQYNTLRQAKIAVFPFANNWCAECPLCEYYDMNCDRCALRSCSDGSAYEQLRVEYREPDLHKFVSGCAEIINRCYNRLEELGGKENDQI